MARVVVAHARRRPRRQEEVDEDFWLEEEEEKEDAEEKRSNLRKVNPGVSSSLLNVSPFQRARREMESDNEDDPEDWNSYDKDEVEEEEEEGDAEDEDEEILDKRGAEGFQFLNGPRPRYGAAEVDADNDEDSEEAEGSFELDIEGLERLEFQDLFSAKSPLVSPSLLEYYNRRMSGELQAQDLPPGWIDAFVTAMQGNKFLEIRNLYARVGIQIRQNFDDFQPGPAASVAEQMSLCEWSTFKARTLYTGTGLPAIAETTSFEIAGDVGAKSDKAYYTREMNNDEIEKRIQKLQGIADPNRVTKFETWVAYNDGENEIVTHGLCEVALIFSSPSRAAISRSTALDNLYMKLTELLHLNLGHFEVSPHEDELGQVTDQDLIGGAMLRARILREGKALTGGILNVSSFVNHQVDAELMDLCGIELAERLRHTMPNKVLTVEATGLIPALSVARRLEIPLVFARKSRTMTISDSFQTMYRSQTKGVMSELIVSVEYLCSNDRVIVIDDFLAGGSTAEGLFRLAAMARAKVVGVGVLIEKRTDGGRAFLAGYDVPVESLAKILSLEQGRIEIAQEKPFGRLIVEDEDDDMDNNHVHDH
eukprot:CAMPEP_0184683132 /NCGR_PEP_ID=MMETSP0312-20130426/9986_1 /TAXON_ID=31354 /ORGANISM="Compsopogon coeruleus, Strain SAG 36.94" /LENGTH=593 /DNA_ID=CAMNT_0027135223 /DNA_START=169 /DNA_END=1950 /DNA_ORIENTATION=-